MASLFGIPADRMKIPKIVAGSTVMDIEIEAPSACAGVVCGASGYCLEGECICNEGHRTPASCKGGGDCTCSQQTCASVTMYLLCTYYDCVCLLCAYYILTMHLLGARPTASAASSAAPATARAARCRCRCCSPPLAGARPHAPPAPLPTRAASVPSVTPRARHAPALAQPSARAAILSVSPRTCARALVSTAAAAATMQRTSHSCAPVSLATRAARRAILTMAVPTRQPCHASYQACTGPG